MISLHRTYVQEKHAQCISGTLVIHNIAICYIFTSCKYMHIFGLIRNHAMQIFYSKLVDTLHERLLIGPSNPHLVEAR